MELFLLLLSIVFSEEIPTGNNLNYGCPTIPDNYVSISSEYNSFTNQKLFSCRQLLDKRLIFTNCVLKISYCTFNSVNVYNNEQRNVGIIFISINNDMEISQTETYEFNNCLFYNCDGGCIHIENSEISREFNFYECSFDKCISYNGGSAIHLQTTGAKIEKCFFFNNGVTYDGGFIYYDPPDYGDSDSKLIINDNFFHKPKTNYFLHGFIYLKHDNLRFIFTNNKCNIHDNYPSYIINAGGSLNDIQGLTIENNWLNLYYENAIVNKNAENFPKNGFKEIEVSDCIFEDTPDYGNDNTHCGNIHENENKMAVDKPVGIYYCLFNRISNDDDELGGAIFISTSNTLETDIKVPFQVHHCFFTICSADYGGAIYISSSENNRLFEIFECKFELNRDENSITATDESSCGGAVYIKTRAANVQITKCNFDSNVASNGAAIYYCTGDSTKLLETNEKDSSNDLVLCIKQCNFYHNQCNLYGGAIDLFLTNNGQFKQIEIIDCTFNENYAEQFDSGGDKPEYSGAIHFEFNSLTAASMINEASDFIVQIIFCTFKKNTASYYGGAISFIIKNLEPPKPIVISHCIFMQNKAEYKYGQTLSGKAGDIYISRPSSELTTAPTYDNNDPYLNIINCSFENSYANLNGGSFLIEIQNTEISRPIEIKGCSFKDCTSAKGGSVEIVSVNPDALLHLIDCKFNGRSSFYFNSIYGLVEKCEFINIQNTNPIYYECNSQSAGTDKSLTIVNCKFTQTNDIDPLIFFVPKECSVFNFNYNEIKIDTENKKTWIFGCSSDAAPNIGKWNFKGNDNYPSDEEYINNANAKQINFPPSCTNGFNCGFIPSSSEEEPESSSEVQKPESSSEVQKPESSSEVQEPESSSEEPESSSDKEPENSSSEEQIQSSSEELPTIELVPGTNCEKNKRCSFDGSDMEPSFIDFSNSDYLDITYKNDGGSIQIIN